VVLKPASYEPPGKEKEREEEREREGADDVGGPATDRHTTRGLPAPQPHAIDHHRERERCRVIEEREGGATMTAATATMRRRQGQAERGANGGRSSPTETERSSEAEG